MHGGFTDAGVDDSIGFVANSNWLLGDDFVHAHALYGVVRAGDFSNDRIVIVGVEPAAIAHLSSGFGVERSVIEDDLSFVTGAEFLCALAIVQEGENLATFRARLAVALEDGSRKLLVLGVGGLLGCTLPRGSRTFALLSQGKFEGFSCKF